MSRTILIVLLAVLPACSSTSEPPLELFGVSSGHDALFVINVDTGVATIVGPLDPTPPGYDGAFPTPVAMAARPVDGALFIWENSRPSKGLAIVDRCTGLPARVQGVEDPQLEQIGSLAFHNGKLYGVGGAGYRTLFELNPDTSAQTLVGAPQSPNQSPGQIASMDGGSSLYGLTSSLQTISTTDGRIIAQMPLSGAAVPPGSLRAMTYDPKRQTLVLAGEILADLSPNGVVSNVRPLIGVPFSGSGLIDYPQGLAFGPSRQSCPAPPATAWKYLSHGIETGCALDASGNAYCWGGGLGGAGTTNAPTPVQGSQTFRMVTVGVGHACGISTAGSSYCWGYNAYGQVGVPPPSTQHAPSPVLGSFATIAAGGWHSCALASNGEMYCWGRNDKGQLGDGTTTDRSTPTLVAGGLRFVEIAAGQEHTCAVTAAGSAYCWGANGNGQLGIGSAAAGAFRKEPAQVAGGLTYRNISAGVYHSCGVTTRNEAFCWGANPWGALGSAPPTSACERFECSATPSAVLGGIAFSRVAAIAAHSCGITLSGLVYCWGLAPNGQLGAGYIPSSICSSTAGGSQCAVRPLPVFGGQSFVSIAGGDGMSCALRANGLAYCWGTTNYGTLGDGTTTSSDKPIQIANP